MCMTIYDSIKLTGLIPDVEAEAITSENIKKIEDILEGMGSRYAR